MREEKTTPSPSAESSDDERIARLLRFAGPRPAVSAERTARVQEAVARQWQGVVRARRRRMTLWGAGSLAAAALVVIVASTQLPPLAEDLPTIEAVTVASLERVTGDVRLARDEQSSPAPVGAVVTTHTTVTSGPGGRVALRLDSGHSVRLDVGSSLRFDSPTHMVLEQGAVYVDSAGAETPVLVSGPLGVVHEIGTQFEVRVGIDSMRVRVREGSVVLDHDRGVVEAPAGAEIRVDDRGQIAQSEVLPHDAGWAWILEITPGFDLEGRHLDEFLAWIVRETGWGVRYADEETARAAPEIVLHGSIEDLTPLQAITAVLPTCGLGHRLDDGLLVVSRRPT